MNDAARLVEAYLDAVLARDPPAVRRLLSDQGFHYESPIARFDDPDDFVQFLLLSAGILQRIERRHCCVDGEHVCHWLVFITHLSERLATPAAQLTRVADGRIQSIELLFDPHRYRLLFEVDDPTEHGRHAVA